MFKNLDRRALALYILCLGDLMIVLDTTIVNVALPSIKASLHFSDVSLVWVINAYILTFSGFLLLGGRLGDIYGHRRVFLSGLTLFTLASLTCGLANSQFVLIAARGVQGLGGAVVSAVALSLIMNLFITEEDRAWAMGIFGFVAAGGGAIGVFLGGVLTGSFDWHWVFLVNIPIGILVFVLCYFLLPHSVEEDRPRSLDAGGALTITLSLMLAVYAVVNGNSLGWFSFYEILIYIGSILLFVGFLAIERSAVEPLVPMSIFRRGNISVISCIGILWSAAMFSWFFISALYMQLVLGFTPFLVGLAFLPANIIMAVFSLGLSARIVMLYGKRGPIALGMAFIAMGLLLFALAPIHGQFWVNVFPAMCLLGFGAGIAFNPVLLVGTEDIPQEESGLASGVLNTAFMMGGSLGLAILASLASYMTMNAFRAGAIYSTGLLLGYHSAFFMGALSAILAAAIALVFLGQKDRA
jgi:EmrB/QacA subfamily drug resistance transporter